MREQGDRVWKKFRPAYRPNPFENQVMLMVTVRFEAGHSKLMLSELRTYFW